MMPVVPAARLSRPHKDNQLYINNTQFTTDMGDSHWVALNQEF